MMSEINQSLPAPHEAIVLLSVVEHAAYRTIEYAAPTLEAFVAADVISENMLAEFKIGRRVLTWVINGQIARCERRRWYGNRGGWRVVWHTHCEHAATLPGILAAGKAEARGEPAMLSRERTVRIGRRPVRWTVIEHKLIVVDWAALRVRPVETTAA